MESLRVLVVDDEVGMRTAVTRTLSGHRLTVDRVGRDFGFELFEAGSAEEAEEQISRHRPQLMLLDQKLPGITGIELLEHLADNPGAPLTVMITAYATIETAIQATKRGAYDFLPKPFTPQELRATVTKAAEHVVVSEAAARLARERRQVRFQFLSVLAHELKSPLNAVQSFIDILRDQGETLAKKDREMIIMRSSVRLHYMRKMIDDLLDLTRIESGQKNRALAPIDLLECVHDAVESVRPDAEARSISITEPPDPCPAYADRGEMQIICNNLISNAVKYNRDGGGIEIVLGRDGDGVTVSVSDTGYGLTPEEAGRLFEDFVRIRNEHTRNVAGSGLGLSIVRKIARLNGGDVSVRSIPGEGSTFSVTMILPEESTAPG